MTATILGPSPDGGLNEHDLNQWCRRMALLLHPEREVPEMECN